MDISNCELFDTNYKFKIKLLCISEYTNESKDGTGKFHDIYIKSHNKYYKIRCDFALFKNKDPISVIEIEDFKDVAYLRFYKNLISIEGDIVNYPEINYFVPNNNNQIELAYSYYKNSNDFLIKTNFFNFSNTGHSVSVFIDNEKMSLTSRDDMLKKILNKDEFDKIKHHIKENDEFQNKCFKEERKKHGNKKSNTSTTK